MSYRIYSIFIALLLMGSPAVAQDKIQELKDKAAADLKAETESLKLKYLVALEKLQKALAADGNLDGAVAVKNESKRASDEEIKLLTVAPSSAAGTSSGTSTETDTATTGSGQQIVLLAKDARLGNGTQFEEKRSIINGWSRYGAYASWTLNNIDMGTYKVTLNYFAGNLGGGLLSVKTRGASDRISIAGAGKWDEPRQYVIGNVRVSDPDNFTIAALQGRSREMIYVESVVFEKID